MESKCITDDNWIKTKVIWGHPCSKADFMVLYKFKDLNFEICSEIFLFPSMNPSTHTHSRFLDFQKCKKKFEHFLLFGCLLHHGIYDHHSRHDFSWFVFSRAFWIKKFVTFSLCSSRYNKSVKINFLKWVYNGLRRTGESQITQRSFMSSCTAKTQETKLWA